MKNKTFMILLVTLLSVCSLVTIAHLCYAAYAYEHCSIIYFIAREWWF